MSGRGGTATLMGMDISASRRVPAILTRWAQRFPAGPFIATTHPCSDADLVVQTFCDTFERGVAPSSRAGREIAARRPRTRGTGGDLEMLRRREHAVLDWFIRVYVPAWLRTARLHDVADRLVALDDITDVASAVAAKSAVEAARSAAGAELTVVCAGISQNRVVFARDAARASHYASAGIAATVAGSGVLGWPLTGDAAGAARWAAGERAALDACTTTLVRAVGSSPNPSEAAEAAVHETTAELQQSAWRLIDQLCDQSAGPPAAPSRTGDRTTGATAHHERPASSVR